MNLTRKFPLTPTPLPKERGNRRQPVHQPGAPVNLKRTTTSLPLLGERVGVRGTGTTHRARAQEISTTLQIRVWDQDV
jgi:hypothetical protein